MTQPRKKTKQLAEQKQSSSLVKAPSNWGNYNSAPVPSRFRTRLKFVTSATYNPGLTTAYYRWNLNSLYQVDYPSGGHQPLGFDQLTPLYGKYKVFKTHYSIKQLTSTTLPSMVMMLPINNQTSAYTTISEMAEKAGCASKLSNSYTPAHISGSVNLASLAGRTKAEYLADDIFGANNTASPAEVMVLHLGIMDLGSSNVSGAFCLELQFDAEFYDPLQPSQS
jgi:hypothetical protein